MCASRLGASRQASTRAWPAEQQWVRTRTVSSAVSGCRAGRQKDVERVGLVSGDEVRLDGVVHPAVGDRGLGVVVLAHGITAEMDEGGMFVRLADRLAGVGWTVLRFSFRGHGGSGGTQRGVTVAGEMLDLDAAVGWAAERCGGGRLVLVASSFGAVPALLLSPYLEGRLGAVVLWNPVLDVRRTFVEPELPWGLENFGPERQGLLGSRGFLVVDGEFELGRVLFEEFRYYGDAPVRSFVSGTTPALVVHGDQDTYVSYEVARDAAAARANCEFHTVVGSDHGFDSREREDEAIDVTARWLDKLTRA